MGNVGALLLCPGCGCGDGMGVACVDAMSAGAEQIALLFDAHRAAANALGLNRELLLCGCAETSHITDALSLINFVAAVCAVNIVATPFDKVLDEFVYLYGLHVMECVALHG